MSHDTVRKDTDALMSRPSKGEVDNLMSRKTKAEDFFKTPLFTVKGTTEEVQRQNVVSTLLDDELSFVHDLESVIDIFLDPLRFNELMTKDEMRKVFSNIENVCVVTGKLASILRDAILTIGVSDFRIGLCFRVNIDLFNVFVEYMKNYSGVEDMLKSALERKPRLKEFLEKTEALPELNGRKLVDFLRLPLSRLKKFQQSFKEMLIYTKEDHPDFQNLLFVFGSFTQYFFLVEESHFKDENRLRIVDIDARIDRSGINTSKGEIPEPLVDESRVLVREGPLLKTNAHGRKQERYVFVFNDSLLYTVVKEKNGKEMIHPKGALKMKKIVMKRAFTNKSQTKQTMELRRMDLNKMYRFTAETTKEGSFWREDVENLINLAHDGDLASDLGKIPYFDASNEDNTEKIGEIQRRLVFSDSEEIDLIRKDRWLIRQGCVVVKNNSTTVTRMSQFVLFNDSLFCGTEMENNKWMTSFCYPLHYFLIEESDEEHAIIMVNMKEADYFTVYFRSGLHKYSWVRTLCDCIVNYIKGGITRSIPSETDLSSMQASVKQLEAIDFDNKVLVKEGRVNIAGKNSNKHRTLFLFEDCLIITREYLSAPLSDGKNLRYQVLSTMSPQDWIVHSLKGNKFSIVSMTNATTSTLLAISEEEKAAWVDLMQKLSDEEPVHGSCSYIDFMAQDRENGDILVFLKKSGSEHVSFAPDEVEVAESVDNSVEPEEVAKVDSEVAESKPETTSSQEPEFKSESTPETEPALLPGSSNVNGTENVGTEAKEEAPVEESKAVDLEKQDNPKPETEKKEVVILPEATEIEKKKEEPVKETADDEITEEKVVLEPKETLNEGIPDPEIKTVEVKRELVADEVKPPEDEESNKQQNIEVTPSETPVAPDAVVSDTKTAETGGYEELVEDKPNVEFSVAPVLVPDAAPVLAPELVPDSTPAVPDAAPVFVPDSTPYVPDAAPELMPDSTPVVPDAAPELMPDSTPAVPDAAPVLVSDSAPVVPDAAPVLVPDSTPYVPDAAPVLVPDSAPVVPDAAPVLVPDSTPYVPDAAPELVPDSTPAVPDAAPVLVPDSAPVVPDAAPVLVPESTSDVPDPSPVLVPDSAPVVPDAAPVLVPDSATAVPDTAPVLVPDSTSDANDSAPVFVPYPTPVLPDSAPVLVPDSDVQGNVAGPPKRTPPKKPPSKPPSKPPAAPNGKPISPAMDVSDTKTPESKVEVPAETPTQITGESTESKAAQSKIEEDSEASESPSGGDVKDPKGKQKRQSFKRRASVRQMKKGKELVPMEITADSTIKEIEALFPGQKLGLKPDSKFLMQTSMVKENVHGRKQERRVFLFNDKFIYAKEQKSKGKVKFVVKGNLNTGEYLVRNIRGVDVGFALMRLDLTNKKEVKFYCKDSETRALWVSTISDNLKNVKD